MYIYCLHLQDEIEHDITIHDLIKKKHVKT